MDVNAEGLRAAGPAARLEDSKPGDSLRPEIRAGERVWIWGVPFAPWTMSETVAAIGELIQQGKPRHIIAANTHYVMLSNRDPALRAINSGAEFIVADGMPLVWASRFGRSPIPERVAGSDLLFHFSEEASVRGYSLFLLGGAEGVAEEAAQRLTGLYPGLQVVGTACPPFREWSTEEEADLIADIRAARPDFLITALTLPRGDQWLAANLLALGVPVVFNGGAASDFAAGTIRRAPRWLRRRGLEWAFRLWLEPRRLWLRYAQDACFIARMIAMSLWNFVRSKAAHGH
jgi:N-acetylglucosaminyldiphosphoundecaprenol N-acetyl-beta-D-mannosaminyltransferase